MTVRSGATCRIWLTVVLSLYAVAGHSEARDPTAPPAAVVRAATDAAPRRARAHQLNAILIRDERRSAAIDGVWVRVGDRVGNARVLQIGNDEVIIRRDNGGDLRLRIAPSVSGGAAETNMGADTATDAAVAPSARAERLASSVTSTGSAQETAPGAGSPAAENVKVRTGAVADGDTR